MDQPTPTSQLPDEALVGALLLRVSRTFAMSVPLLPERLREQVGIAYLLSRIADTVEAGVLVNREAKRRLFDGLVLALRTNDAEPARAFSAAAPAVVGDENRVCLELTQELPRLLKMLSRDPEADVIVRRRLAESVLGRRRFATAGGSAGNLRLKSMLELRQHCYFVAGILGELLTELFVRHEPQLAGAHSKLMSLSPLFGEGLRLVSVLNSKETHSDATHEQQLVHPLVPREQLFDQARGDLSYAREYIRVLQKTQASSGLVQFAQMPVRLATATLDCVQKHGPGSEVSREVIRDIVASVVDSESTARSSDGQTAIKVLLAAPRGFCAGVDMAVETLDIAINRLGTPIYVYHEIVHNRYVVESFIARGAVFVDAVDDVPRGANLIFSAHGVSPEVRTAANERGLFTIDATCPLVAKVHIEAARFAKLGYQIILIGHEGHDEVVGTVGEAPDCIRVVQSEADIAALEFADDEKLAWLTQTTLSVSETAGLVSLLESRFPHIVGPHKDDICYATQNRQAAIGALCDEADAVIVVGSQNSSNSQRLRELAAEHGVRAWLVDGAGELVRNDLTDCKTLALTAGASAPETAVQDVLDWLNAHFDLEVEVRTHTREDRVFALPVELSIHAGKERPS